MNAICLVIDRLHAGYFGALGKHLDRDPLAGPAGR